MRELVTEAQLLQIYWATIEALYGYASRRSGGDRELAEDVVQEAWFRATREWRKAGVPTSPLAWLTAVTRNLIVDQLRRRVDLPLDSVAASDILTAVDQNEVSDSAEIVSAVTRAMLRLPNAEAELLEAFHFDRCKVAQIATSYGISERAVEGRLRRARERLRHELEITMGKAAGGLV
jgi:RNA polymerase sigma-70 factor (ECF subfamily)